MQQRFARVATIFFVALSISSGLLISPASAVEVTLAWDANIESDLVGYRVFSRRVGQVYDYDDPAWGGAETSCTICDLNDNSTYYFVVRAYDSEGFESADSAQVVYGPENNSPPSADAGPDQAVDEGETVRLNGYGSLDQDDGIDAYRWEQTDGILVTLSDPTAPDPTFVTPPVGSGGTEVTFKLTVADSGGLEDSDEMSVTIYDNGLTGFPEDVLTVHCSTGEHIGIKVEKGGTCIFLDAVDPASLFDASNRPDDVPYGLIDIEIKVDTPGSSVLLTFYLPTPAPEGYTWYKYSPSNGWHDYSTRTTFNSARNRAVLSLTDGGAGDDDGASNGVIVDASGLGYAASIAPADAGGREGGGGGGCIIGTAGSGPLIEPFVNAVREFQGRIMLTSNNGLCESSNQKPNMSAFGPECGSGFWPWW